MRLQEGKVGIRERVEKTDPPPIGRCPGHQWLACVGALLKASISAPDWRALARPSRYGRLRRRDRSNRITSHNYRL